MAKQDHLLIVDDDPQIRQLLCDYLSDAGFQSCRGVVHGRRTCADDPHPFSTDQRLIHDTLVRQP